METEPGFLITVKGEMVTFVLSTTLSSHGNTQTAYQLDEQKLGGEGQGLLGKYLTKCF